MIIISSSNRVKNRYRYYKVCEKSISRTATRALWQAGDRFVAGTSWYSLLLHSWRLWDGYLWEIYKTSRNHYNHAPQIYSHSRVNCVDSWFTVLVLWCNHSIAVWLITRVHILLLIIMELRICVASKEREQQQIYTHMYILGALCSRGRLSYYTCDGAQSFHLLQVSRQSPPRNHLKRFCYHMIWVGLWVCVSRLG